MEWTPEAENLLSRVPFFVRKRVRKRVEDEAVSEGSRVVETRHLAASKERFLNRMDREVKGYQLETCFGADRCPNTAVESNRLVERLEVELRRHNLRDFLKESVQGPLKLHHEFRVAVADCPNACSRPQIADIGIIGSVRPEIADEECSKCGACVERCPDTAVSLPDSDTGPVIDRAACLECGLCIRACPMNALQAEKSGYRILLGGKLGRRPQLGRPLPGIYSEDETIETVSRCLDHFKAHNRGGERFGTIINRTGTAFVETVEVDGTTKGDSYERSGTY